VIDVHDVVVVYVARGQESRHVTHVAVGGVDEDIGSEELDAFDMRDVSALWHIRYGEVSIGANLRGAHDGLEAAEGQEGEEDFLPGRVGISGDTIERDMAGNRDIVRVL